MDFILENMCRTCMNEDGQMFSVFSAENRSVSNICYADMLMACAALHVDRDDDLPQQICQHCLKHLSIAYSFKQQSERSEATLREITKNPDIEFIKEEVLDPDVELDENDDDIILDNDSNEDELNLEDSGHVSNEFRLTKHFLEDEFIENQEIEEPTPDKRRSKLDKVLIKTEKIFNETDALETEFLEDEYILDDENNTAIESKAAFLDDNILVQNMLGPEDSKFHIVYDLETLKKSVLKPRSTPLPNTLEKQKIDPRLYKNLNLDLIRKSVLTPKSKPKGRKREFKCTYCEQTFRTQLGFKRHKKNHGKRLKCELCLKEFRSTHGLRYHMKIHNGIKNFACNFGDCTKRFRLKQALDKHLSIHRKEKNHLCSLCGKTYSTYDALTYHLRAHRGERPYLCIHCGKTFKQSCHLKSHSWIHSGIKPHVCNHCGKCYTSSHQLKKHMVKHGAPAPISKETNYVKDEVIEDGTDPFETAEGQIDDSETHTAISTVIYS